MYAAWSPARAQSNTLQPTVSPGIPPARASPIATNVRQRVDVGSFGSAARAPLRLGQARVVCRDRGMRVQPHRDPSPVRPAEEAARVREQLGPPVPAVPAVRRLEVGVDHQHVQRDALGAEAGQQRRVVRLAVGEVRARTRRRMPGGEERRRSGQPAQVGEAAQVVAGVAEEVAVLVGAGALRPRRGGAGGLGERVAVVQQVPAVAGEEPVVQTHGTRGQVEGAVPAAEVAAGGRAVAGILGHRVGAYLERRRPGARPGRGGKAGPRGDDPAVAPQPDGQVGRRERSRAAAVAQGQAPRPDGQDPGASAGANAPASSAAVHDVQRRPVLEAAVRGVLEPDQRRGEDLEARVAVADGPRVRGGSGAHRYDQPCQDGAPRGHSTRARHSGPISATSRQPASPIVRSKSAVKLRITSRTPASPATASPCT